MSVLKRLRTTLSATVEQWVGEIENHDAVVAAGLEQARAKFAQASVRQARLQQVGVDMHARLAELRDAQQRWETRARQSGADEATALECLRRRRACAQQAASLQEAIVRHEAQTQALGRELDAARGRLDELKQRREFLRTREATAEVAAAQASFEEQSCATLDSVFERWETQIATAQLQGEAVVAADPLAQAFEREEEQAELRAELAALRGEHGDEQ